MISFISEQLDGDNRRVEYRVSVDGGKVSIDSNGPDGLDVFGVRATWDADEETLTDVCIIGEDDPLFTEWVQQKIECEIAEELAAREHEAS